MSEVNISSYEDEDKEVGAEEGESETEDAE